MISRFKILFLVVCISIAGQSQDLGHYMQEASQYEALGQYGLALQSYEKAIGLVPYDSSYVMANALNSYANVYLKNGYKAEARTIYRQAEKELSLATGDDRVELMHSKILLNIGSSLLADSVKHAVNYLRQASKILANYPSEKQAYALLLNNIGEAEEQMRHYQNAYSFFTQSLKEQTSIVGDNSPELLHPLMNVATCLYNMPADSTSGLSLHHAIPYIEQYVRILRNALAENLTLMNDEERRVYWDMQQRALYNATQIVAYSAYQSQGDQQESATRLLLDIVLLRKSLLLDASLNDRKQDEGFSYLDIHSHQLQQVLRRDEQVIEMVEVGKAPRSEYMAIIVTRKEAPKLVPLIGLSSFLQSNATNHQALNNKQLDQLMWEPLLKKAKLPTIIYLVPDGLLQMIPVEYVLQDRYRVCERYEVRRLTSSKQLLSRSNSNESVLARPCLVGGCLFNAQATDIEMEEGNGFQIDQLPTIQNEQLESAVQNEYFLPLPASTTEVSEIDRILREAQYPVQTYLGLHAHKNCLNNAQQLSPTLLHIATHGLFYPSVEKGMQQSGLAFSGANTLANRTQGIMTADEFSRLLFPNLQLAVLSACHTGQGEVTGEGVWGMQRACKMTGCKAMVLTLWEVGDEITHTMMTQLYQHLVKGEDIYTSFAKATAHIRQQTFMVDNQPISGNSPKIWCAYILVDAL